MVLAEGTTLRLKSTIIPILARDNCRNWPPLMSAINYISVLCYMNWRSYCQNQKRACIYFPDLKFSFNIYTYNVSRLLMGILWDWMPFLGSKFDSNSPKRAFFRQKLVNNYSTGVWKKDMILNTCSTLSCTRHHYCCLRSEYFSLS